MNLFWKLIQLSVFLAVVFSAIHYGWAEGTSGLAVAVVGVFVAFLVTAIPFAIIDLITRLRVYRDAKRRAVLTGRE